MVLFIHAVYTGAIPCYSLAVSPPYHVHVSQELSVIQVAGVARPVRGLADAEAATLPRSAAHPPRRPSVTSLGDCYFATPGSGASVKPI